MTFRELAAEWLEHLERERGAKPSTLSDYRYMLAEPGTPHRRGKGKSPGRHGRVRRPARREDHHPARCRRSCASWTARACLPATVNKHRQVLSAIFNYARRADTHGLPSNPVAATTKRREPPPAVLDFYEPEEIETLASRRRRRRYTAAHSPPT